MVYLALEIHESLCAGCNDRHSLYARLIRVGLPVCEHLISNLNREREGRREGGRKGGRVGGGGRREGGREGGKEREREVIVLHRCIR